MIDYSKAKIYKLVSGDLTYIGSTINGLSRRKADHKAHCGRGITSEILFKTGLNVDIVLIENYPCANKEELHKRERFWIEQTDCVNKVIPTRTRKEYRKTYLKQSNQRVNNWRKNNKERYVSSQKIYKAKYRENNKCKIKEYYECYKDKYNAKRREQRLLKKIDIMFYD